MGDIKGLPEAILAEDDSKGTTFILINTYS